jgi:hypothetical protein
MPFHEDNVREIFRKVDRQSTITRPYEPLKKACLVTSKRPKCKRPGHMGPGRHVDATRRRLAGQSLLTASRLPPECAERSPS